MIQLLLFMTLLQAGFIKGNPPLLAFCCIGSDFGRFRLGQLGLDQRDLLQDPLREDGIAGCIFLCILVIKRRPNEVYY